MYTRLLWSASVFFCDQTVESSGIDSLSPQMWFA